MWLEVSFQLLIFHFSNRYDFWDFVAGCSLPPPHFLYKFDVCLQLEGWAIKLVTLGAGLFIRKWNYFKDIWRSFSSLLTLISGSLYMGFDLELWTPTCSNLCPINYLLSNSLHISHTASYLQKYGLLKKWNFANRHFNESYRKGGEYYRYICLIFFSSQGNKSLENEVGLRKSLGSKSTSRA